MILSAQSIRDRVLYNWVGDEPRPMIAPFMERTTIGTMTFGLSAAGYDIRIAEQLTIPPAGFALASTVERFDMPHDLLARVTDKSSWARRGLCVQNTVIEPGWRGYLTLELTNHSSRPITVNRGHPIAQVIFETLDHPTVEPYDGKYQDQEAGPQQAR